jgi:hypothetical protein
MRPIVPALLLACFLAGCGGDDEGETTTSPIQPPATATEPADDRADNDPAEREQGVPDSPAPDPDRAAERAAVRTTRKYIAALDDRDGGALCALIAPRVIEEVALPRRRGGCAASLRASIGYRDPRGLPVFEGIQIAEVPAVEIDGNSARVVVTTVTEFADRDEPSIEDDVIYLERSGKKWLIAKPSSSLYRAVGIADVPPSVLAPPGG